MKGISRSWLGPVLLVALIAVVSALAFLPVEADNGNSNPGVLPIGSHPYGKSYAEWGIAWSEWWLAIPAATNPIADDTGEHCDVDQSGPVWFLGGSTGNAIGDSPDRDCTVPAGKSLFFPVLNITCWSPEDGETLEDLIDCTTLLDFLDEEFTIELTVEVDGVAIEGVHDYRVGLGFGVVDFPEGGLFGPPGVRPAVTDGWYLMLAPLSAGEHTISLAGSIAEFDLEFGANYTITVARGKSGN